MARSRMIRPEFWDDEKLSYITRDARLVYIALWNFSDDYGVVKGHSAWLKNNIFPYDVELKLNQFDGWLKELETAGRIIPFAKNGECYYSIPKFLKHQTINRPSQNRNPVPPDGLTECSLTTHTILSGKTESKYKQKEKQKENTRARAWPSNFELTKDLKTYAVENGIDPCRIESFFEDFKQWALSKGATYKDWAAAFRARVNKAPEYGKQFMIKTDNGIRVNWNDVTNQK